MFGSRELSYYSFLFQNAFANQHKNKSTEQKTPLQLSLVGFDWLVVVGPPNLNNIHQNYTVTTTTTNTTTTTTTTTTNTTTTTTTTTNITTTKQF